MVFRIWKQNFIKKVDCLSPSEETATEEAAGDIEPPPKPKSGFRNRKFIAYEDRIRAYSTPDKIFRYFATLKCMEEDGTAEIYMTPDDFLRAITPGVKQPDGLELDSFRRFDPKVAFVQALVLSVTLSSMLHFHQHLMSPCRLKQSNTLVSNSHVHRRKIDRGNYYQPQPVRAHDKLNLSIPKDSVFYCLDENALISFTDFVFLLTVISTPPRQFEIAFRMFDINGDGELDANEFNVVRTVILDTTAVGKRHRDHLTTGSTLKPVIRSALHKYFFGADGNEKLTIAKFIDFQARLQAEITRLEFERLGPQDGLISERAFAKSLLTYAGFSENRRRIMLRRVKQKFDTSEDDDDEEAEEKQDSKEEPRGISFQDFLDFSRLLRSISDLDTALTFHTLAGAAIDPDTFLHMAKVVANVHLRPHVVDVVFTLFDENDDGQLSYKEFVQVMKNRLLRGLDKPMDTGFVRLLSALIYCTKQEIKHKLET
ncbi:unnamed protein product [Dibothriocephalus latus]|uniref:EF-hand domain-containing protein n=1 Tax=Dibothriocephalus latus TaxID=60516 RepID=A0A3P6U607_DIBLA|nr:unnamed protein product [Dibothriocephalus latus]